MDFDLLNTIHIALPGWDKTIHLEMQPEYSNSKQSSINFLTFFHSFSKARPGSTLCIVRLQCRFAALVHKFCLCFIVDFGRTMRYT